MEFMDANGNPQKASAEDLLRMAGVNPPNPRPDFVEDAHIDLLDGLSRTGMTDPLKLIPLFVSLAGLTEDQAHELVRYWKGRQG